jgi:hypothetical protein
MVAILIFHSKYLYHDGAIREMILWRLPTPTKNSRHGFKYRLFYGTKDGTSFIRYDNEKGKGDHRHLGDKEEPYRFINVETLIEDFLKDINRTRGEQIDD